MGAGCVDDLPVDALELGDPLTDARRQRRREHLHFPMLRSWRSSRRRSVRCLEQSFNPESRATGIAYPSAEFLNCSNEQLKLAQALAAN